MIQGIDYGLGRTNIDHATGIRYGCISQHSVEQAWTDSSEADSGEPTCPKCGADAVEYDSAKHDGWRPSNNSSPDYACETCQYVFDGDEPQGYVLDDGEYVARDCLDSDILIIKSPYYTYAPFCSPCVPGAGNLDAAGDLIVAGLKNYPRVYCFGHEWFEGKAPYRVFRVSDNTEVEA